MRHSFQMTASYFIRLAILVLGALLCGGGMQAATAKTKAKPAPAKTVKKSTAHKPAARRRAPFHRAITAPAKPNPLLVGVNPVSPLVAPLFPPLAPPPPIPGTCFACADPLLATAYSLLGVRYRFGGSSPEYGFDCSGFTMYTYKTSLNVPLPSSAPAQFQVGVPVSKEELVPGDLVFFRPRRFGWHVGMYVGDGAFIHAPNRRRTVSVTPLNDPYWQKAFVGARRIPAKAVEEPTAIELSSNN
ncbi:MAG TPA: C40 family peptidase [Paludibaculum sp.]